jgi:hypothetical protein
MAAAKEEPCHSAEDNREPRLDAMPKVHTAAAPLRTQTLSFLSLPCEIRDEIYDLCVGHGRERGYMPAFHPFYRSPYDHCKCLNNPFLRTCRQTRNELLLRFGRVHILMTNVGVWMKHDIRSWLSKITPELVASFRWCVFATSKAWCWCCAYTMCRTEISLKDNALVVSGTGYNEQCQLDLRGWISQRLASVSERLPQVDGQAYLTKSTLWETMEIVGWGYLNRGNGKLPVPYRTRRKIEKRQYSLPGFPSFFRTRSRVKSVQRLLRRALDRVKSIFPI